MTDPTDPTDPLVPRSMTGLSDFVVSLIRTLVPVVVGAVVTVAADRGLDLDPSAWTPLITSTVIGGYYALARHLEARFSWARFLLGIPITPNY